MAAKKNKSGLPLNILIARSHQVATQLVSVQLSISNLIAIVVSAISIVAGTVTFTLQTYPGNWELGIVAGIVGCGLAVLIEGLTLSALIRIRLASHKIKALSEEMNSELNAIDWVALEKTQRKLKEKEIKSKRNRATKQYRRMRTWSTPIVLVGSVASAVAGGLFYHTILSDLGQWQSFCVAALFPFIVTCTFISSELFKDIQEEAIKEGYTGGGLATSALHEEMNRIADEAVFTGIQDHFSSEGSQQSLKDAAVQLVNRKIELIGIQNKSIITEVQDEFLIETISAEDLVNKAVDVLRQERDQDRDQERQDIQDLKNMMNILVQERSQDQERHAKNEQKLLQEPRTTNRDQEREQERPPIKNGQERKNKNVKTDLEKNMIKTDQDQSKIVSIQSFLGKERSQDLIAFLETFSRHDLEHLVSAQGKQDRVKIAEQYACVQETVKKRAQALMQERKESQS